ncbi:hypothetical protein PHMEG_00014086 [Phytophthora megakarya]|uniref:Nuclear pore complex protein n=1 Tax=Phytophthora megakarya TaxID=4795 RepID=A0A225W4P2_9STRA|nr:hypothetical protein PHMEG_00014086 [Phytophthora megakarya]
MSFGGFGNSSAPTSGGFGGFGSGGTSGGFGSSAAASPFGGGAATGGFGSGSSTFGTGAAKPAFGGFGTAAPASGGGFGAQQTTATGFGGFGASAAPSTGFGAAANPATTSGFGTTSAFGGGATTGTFGSSGTSAFGASTPFGAKPAASSSPFGSSSAFGGGVGTTSAFGGGATTGGFGTPTPGSGSMFGNTAGGFGASAAKSPFGATSTNTTAGFGSQATAATGFGGFGAQQPAAAGTAAGQVQVGTGQPPYQPTREMEPTGTGGTANYVSISRMQAYAHKSTEELRYEDYLKRTNPAAAQAAATQNAPAPGATTAGAGAFGGFGAQPATSSAFGSTGAFGSTQPSAFGATSTGGGFGSSAFGSTTISTTAGFGGFGSQSAAPATSGGLFGSTAARPATVAFVSFIRGSFKGSKSRFSTFTSPSLSSALSNSSRIGSESNDNRSAKEDEFKFTSSLFRNSVAKKLVINKCELPSTQGSETGSHVCIVPITDNDRVDRHEIGSGQPRLLKPSDDGKYSVIFCNQTNKKTFSLRLFPNETVKQARSEVKQLLRESSALTTPSIVDIELVLKGRIVHDANAMEELQLKEGDSIDVIVIENHKEGETREDQSGSISVSNKTDGELSDEVAPPKRFMTYDEYLASASRDSDDLFKSTDQKTTNRIFPASPSCPMLKNKDYYTIPSYERLQDMTDDELSRVEKFTVGCRGLGAVEWIGKTDVRELDLDELVYFEKKEVIVYRDDEKKHELGKGLNKPAIVELLGIFPPHKSTFPEKYKDRVRQRTQDIGAIFLDYSIEKGIWRFRVEHFSRYGFDDGDDDDDADMDDYDKSSKELNFDQLPRKPGTIRGTVSGIYEGEVSSSNIVASFGDQTISVVSEKTAGMNDLLGSVSPEKKSHMDFNAKDEVIARKNDQRPTSDVFPMIPEGTLTILLTLMGMRFRLQSRVQKKSSGSFEKRTLLLWKLIQALWGQEHDTKMSDRPDSVFYPLALRDEPHEMETLDSFQTVELRREAISQWFETALKDASFDGISSPEGMLRLLCQHRIAEASDMAMDCGHFRLATMIAQAASYEGTDFRSLIETQMVQWSENGSLEFMDKSLVLIYSVLAGSTEVLSAQKGTSMSWIACLALFLWYKRGPATSLKSAMTLYEDAVSKKQASGSLSQFAGAGTDKDDVLMELMKLYIEDVASLCKVLSPSGFMSQASHHLDYELSWHLHSVLRAIGYKLDRQWESHIHQNFIRQLEGSGLWEDAVYVALNIFDVVERETTCRELLFRNADVLASDLSKRKDLCARLNFPAEWINEALAMRAVANQEYHEAIAHWLAARHYEEAHACLISHVAMRCLFASGKNVLMQLLLELESMSAYIPQWKSCDKVGTIGGGLLLEYLRLEQQKGLEVGHEDQFLQRVILLSQQLSSAACDASAKSVGTKREKNALLAQMCVSSMVVSLASQAVQLRSLLSFTQERELTEDISSTAIPLELEPEFLGGLAHLVTERETSFVESYRTSQLMHVCSTFIDWRA